ncbi:hypothetical protein FJT64_024676 [Amphibalanus amphitrite]|uniref:Alpha-2-macroglobulin bait region domain-containing protein n=1 Tax=Amphibalanus amphitrite TaxID=1232801 RepID=A0A6A4W9W6_AMPAM|nr:hypothetical protein FJT64_024676 [Amphibalanus amphitrite]
MTEFAQRVHSVKITAKRQSDWRGQDEYLSVMTSPSSSYLALDIAQMPVKLPCHGDIRLPLLSTLPKESLVVQLQVMSRNRVVASEIAHLATDELVLHMVPEMSPKTRLLVYSQLESGEVMADTVEMDVETCFPNEATVKDAGLGLRKRGRHPYELTREGALDVFRNLDHNLHPPPMKGFGISEKVSIRATRLLFADMSIPHSVKTGEVLTVPVTVFNNTTPTCRYISVTVTEDRTGLCGRPNTVHPSSFRKEVEESNPKAPAGLPTLLRCQQGVLRSKASLRGLYDIRHRHPDVQFLMTSHLNQGCPENLLVLTACC